MSTPNLVDNSLVSIVGALSASPMIVSMFADVSTGTISSWGEVAAAGVVFSLFVWLITVHIPNREKAAESRQDARDMQQQSRLDKTQTEFLDALKHRDETSRANAASGHAAMEKVIDFQRNVVASNDKLFSAIQTLCEKFDKR